MAGEALACGCQPAGWEGEKGGQKAGCSAALAEHASFQLGPWELSASLFLSSLLEIDMLVLQIETNGRVGFSRVL